MSFQPLLPRLAVESLTTEGRPTPLGRAVLALSDDSLTDLLLAAPLDDPNWPDTGPSGQLLTLLFDHAPARVPIVLAGRAATILRRRSAAAVVLARDPERYEHPLAAIFADTDESPTARLAVGVLLAGREPARYGPAIIALTTDHPPATHDVLTLFLRWAGRHGGAEVVPSVAQLLSLHGERWFAFGPCVEALVARLGEAALPLLVPATEKPSRYDIVPRMLTFLPLAAGRPEVMDRLTSVLREQMRTMSLSLHHFTHEFTNGGPDALPLLKIVYAAHAAAGGYGGIELACAAAAALGTHSLPLLRRAFGEVAAEWTCSLVDHLATHGDDADRTAAAERLAETLPNSHPRVYPFRLRIAMKHFPERFVASLPPLLTHEADEVRIAARELLADRPADALSAAEGLRTDGPAAKRAGVALLAAVGTPEARSMLERWLANEPDPAAALAMFLHLEPLWEAAGSPTSRAALEGRAVKTAKAAKVPAWVKQADLPSLVWANGPPAEKRVVDSLLHRSTDPPTHARLRAARRLLVADTCTAFAAAWLDRCPKTVGKIDRWILAVPAILAGPVVLDELVKLAQKFEKKNSNAVVAALEAIALTDSPAGAAFLAEYGHTRAHLDAATTRLLAEMAARMGVDADDLIDTSASTLGFGPAGLSLTLDGRTFAFSVTPEFRARVSINGGKPTATLPKDTPETVRTRWKELTKRLETVGWLFTARLARALPDRRRWPSRVWAASYGLPHPVLTPAATRFLWIHEAEVGIRHAFRVSFDGATADVTGKPYTPPASGHVLLAHPAEMDAAERDAWRLALPDEPVVSQLGRPVTPARPWTATGLRSERFERELLSRGWLAHEHDSRKRPARMTREYATLGVTAEVPVRPRINHDGTLPIDAGPLRFLRAGREVPFADVPPAAAAEAMADLGETARGTRD